MAHHEPAHSHAPAHPPVLHGTADDEYAYTPEGSTYEHTDANVWVIAKFGIWLAITAVVVHFGIGVLYGALVEHIGSGPFPSAEQRAIGAHLRAAVQ